MFVCLECGEIFEESTEWDETHGLDYGPYEHFKGSPCCGANYVEAFRCDCCGEWITSETYVKTNGGEVFCENCFTICDLDDN